MFNCLICGVSFREELTLYSHIATHSETIRDRVGYTVQRTPNMSTRVYYCTTCAFTTGHAVQMKRHLKMHRAQVSQQFTNKENLYPIEDWLLGPSNMELYTAYSESEFDQGSETSADKLSCELCGLSVTSKSTLRLHLKTHADGEYKCPECSEHFPTQRGLTVHISRHITQASNKKNTKDPVKNKCKECGRTFRQRAYLVAHMAVHGVPRRLECDVCKKCFSTKKRLALHIDVHLRQEKLNKTKDECKPRSGLGRKRKKRREKEFKCDVDDCTFSTYRLSTLKCHKFKHNPFYLCVTCQATFPSRMALKEHMQIHGDRPYQCCLCNKSYKDKHGLGWHKKVQHDPFRLKYTCELCGKTYPFASLLTQHINSTHASEKQSVCDICGKNVSKTYLAMHRRTHGEKQFPCEICNKTFLEKSYLKRHKMVHTGEKPYICSVCGNSFRQHSTLTIHMRTHTGDRPYKCDMCDNAYKTHHNLKKHYKRSGHKAV